MQELPTMDQVELWARSGDITHRLRQYFGPGFEADPRLHPLQLMGFRTEARLWKKSATPEGMEYGADSLEERLAKAAEYADKAGVSLDDIII